MEVIRLNDENITRFSDFIPEDIAENINRTYYRGLVVLEGDAPLAGMIWELRNNRNEDYRESHIVWLVVTDESAGSMLFEEYKSMITGEDIIRSTFALPARASKEEKAFLKSNGFSAELMEGDIITAKLSEVEELDFLSRISCSEEVKPLVEVSQRGFNMALRRMVSRGFYGRCEDIEFLPRLFFENDVSCFFEEDGIITGLLLCHLTPSGKLFVEMMACIGKDYLKLLTQMIAKAVEGARGKYPPETEIMIDRHNNATLALGEKLFPRGFGIPVYIGNRDEIGG